MITIKYTNTEKDEFALDMDITIQIPDDSQTSDVLTTFQMFLVMLGHHRDNMSWPNDD